MNYINFNEIFAGLLAVIPSLYMGFSSGFSTEYIYEQSQEKNLSKEEISWIGSSGLLLAFVGCFVDGYLMDIFGRKILLYSTYLTHCIGWMIIAKTKYFILGRIVTSLAIGLGYASIVYVTEILPPQRRAPFLQMNSVLELFGSLCIYLVEYSISAKTTAFYLSVIAFVLLFSVFFVPESPYWYMLKRKKDEAITSLVWLRDGDELSIDEEICVIEKNLEDAHSAPSYSEAIFIAEWWKILSIFAVYVILTELTGFDIVIPYSVQFFEKFNHTGLDTRIISTIFVAVALAGNIVTMFILEKFERRALVKNANLLNVALLVVAAASETFIHTSASSVVSFMCFFVFGTTISITSFSLPWTIISESLPTEFRGTIFSILSTEFVITYFLMVKYFPNLLQFVSISFIIWSFAFFSLMNYFYVHYFLKETRGVMLH